ncbi:hypothetical protein FRC03_008577 [Tulasnella sp. 419]|nr:hypothetical protein FRC03_008577 [Tulasnella sp. 419]
MAAAPSVAPVDYKYRNLFGRAFNAHRDSYMLPADGEEHYRLDRQHDLLKYDLGNSLYDAPEHVKKVLRPGQTERPRVLDVGTGSGRWALEMAAEFPHADVVAIDLAPPSLTEVSSVPPNCRFEVRNANHPFDDYAGYFDVIHCRCIEMGIVDFHEFLYNIAQALKPGGILLLASGYAQLFDEEHQPLPVTVEGDPKFTWIQHAFGEAYAALHSRHDSALDKRRHWDEWLGANQNFERHYVHDRDIPLGPWPLGLDEISTYVADLMRYNCITLLISFRPLLLSAGNKVDEVDRMIKNAAEELRDLKARTYVRWRYAWGVRSNTPWTSKPDIPVHDETPPSVIFSEAYKAAKARETTPSPSVTPVSDHLV